MIIVLNKTQMENKDLVDGFKNRGFDVVEDQPVEYTKKNDLVSPCCGTDFNPKKKVYGKKSV